MQKSKFQIFVKVNNNQIFKPNKILLMFYKIIFKKISQKMKTKNLKKNLEFI